MDNFERIIRNRSSGSSLIQSPSMKGCCSFLIFASGDDDDNDDECLFMAFQSKKMREKLKRESFNVETMGDIKK